MLGAGSNNSQNRDNSNQKVYPQPMEVGLRHNEESVEALVADVFNNVSSLKTAYMQLQKAHTPYDPEKIRTADKMVVEELHKLSDLKHTYRDKHPGPPSSSPQDARLFAEIQEQQRLLKTYEVMVTKFQTQIQNRDSEILQLQTQIQESTEKKQKLEKKLKHQSSLVKELEASEGDRCFLSIELTPNLLSSTVDAAYKSIHDFSKPFINMMKVAGWDLDSAAHSIQPGVIYVKRSHKKYAFESHICQRMFSSFHEESFMADPAAANITSSESFFHQFLAVREMDPLEMLSQNPDSIFGKFCKSKYTSVVHEKMESSFFGNLDQRNHILDGGHPRTPFYQAFLKLAKSIWMLHRLVHSFDPKVKVFQVKPETEFSEVYMESVVKNIILKEGDQKPKVGLMVMPGFMVGGSVIQSQVYLSGVQCTG